MSFGFWLLLTGCIRGTTHQALSDEMQHYLDRNLVVGEHGPAEIGQTAHVRGFATQELPGSIAREAMLVRCRRSWPERHLGKFVVAKGVLAYSPERSPPDSVIGEYPFDGHLILRNCQASFGATTEDMSESLRHGLLQDPQVAIEDEVELVGSQITVFGRSQERRYGWVVVTESGYEFVCGIPNMAKQSRVAVQGVLRLVPPRYPPGFTSDLLTPSGVRVETLELVGCHSIDDEASSGG